MRRSILGSEFHFNLVRCEHAIFFSSNTLEDDGHLNNSSTLGFIYLFIFGVELKNACVYLLILGILRFSFEAGQCIRRRFLC